MEVRTCVSTLLINLADDDIVRVRDTISWACRSREATILQSKIIFVKYFQLKGFIMGRQLETIVREELLQVTH